MTLWSCNLANTTREGSTRQRHKARWGDKAEFPAEKHREWLCSVRTFFGIPCAVLDLCLESWLTFPVLCTCWFTTAPRPRSMEIHLLADRRFFAVRKYYCRKSWKSPQAGTVKHRYSSLDTTVLKTFRTTTGPTKKRTNYFSEDMHISIERMLMSAWKRWLSPRQCPFLSCGQEYL